MSHMEETRRQKLERLAYIPIKLERAAEFTRLTKLYCPKKKHSDYSLHILEICLNVCKSPDGNHCLFRFNYG